LQYFSIRHFYPWADAVIVPSEGAARDLAAASSLPLDRIRVLPSPVVHRRILELANQPVPHPWFEADSPPVILAVGELCARKDFVTLISAFAKMHHRRPSRLVILGEGRQQKHLLDLARKLGIGSEVSLPGFVTNPFAYMRKAALFALSSRCEGAPVVLMEALAVGAPVISTDCPSGPREILQGGRLGPLVPVGDVDAMAKALVSVLDKPLQAEMLRAAAERYSVESSADRYLSVLGFGSLTEGQSRDLS
jgi:glycosyltransferase involved in cell wall biosynthesis